MIYLNNIKKSFGNKTVLKGISLNINEGEIVVFFGHNGAGKSTLLKIIAGLVCASSGRIHYNSMHFSKREIFFLGHQTGLYHELTIMENIKFFLRLRNENITKDLLKERLKEFGLWQRRNDQVKILSQGMKKRLALLKGFLSNAKLFVLDEPFSGLDIKWKDLLIEKMLEMKQKGKTIILATHLLTEGYFIANKIALLEMGRLIWFENKNNIDEEVILERLKNAVYK